MTLYLDTSALVKLYASESGSAETLHAVADAERLACNLIGYTEIRAALARKHRLREIDEMSFAGSKAQFELDWKGMFILPVDAQTVRSAGDFAERFGLRACDSIHLAAAITLFRETGSQVRFMCFDNALNQAASSLGLIVS